MLTPIFQQEGSKVFNEQKYKQIVNDLILLKKNLLEQYQEQEIMVKIATPVFRELGITLKHVLSRGEIEGDQEQKRVKQIENFGKFFDFLLSLETENIISKVTIFSTMVNFFETAPEDILLQTFDILEKKVFNQNLHQSKNDKESATILNVISKQCNLIMKKLSKTHDTGFRGKIQKLIALVFPLNHPSGLNKAGHFNVKNETLYETLEEVLKQNGGVEEEARFYRNMWALQGYLVNPISIFTAQQLEFNFQSEDQKEQDKNHMSVEKDTTERISEDQVIEEGSLSGEREEGQADADFIEKSPEKKKTKIEIADDTNLKKVLKVIKEVVMRFKADHVEDDLENAQISIKYPKFLSNFSLMKLQLQDNIFRQVFLTQFMIFFDCIQNPIQNPINNDQKRYFVLSEDEQKIIKSITKKVLALLSGNKKRNRHLKSSTLLGQKLTLSDKIKNCLQAESFMAKWKQNKCPTFEKPSSSKVSLKKRDLKRSEKLVSSKSFIQPGPKDLSFSKNGVNLKKYLRQPKESVDKECQSQNIIPAAFPTLADYHLPIMYDLDPEQDIEDTYKHKHNLAFSWRFLRQVSFNYLQVFHGKPEMQKQFHKFEGDSEAQAMILYSKNMRKDISQKREEEEDVEMVEAVDEEHHKSNGQANGQVNGQQTEGNVETPQPEVNGTHAE